MSSHYYSEDLVKIFNRLFSRTNNTHLVADGEEPVYLPASANISYHQIIFTRDYFASALHEISHWCIAGQERRQLIDFGYWYEPDGRSDFQQIAFESVEVKPQALEGVFHEACGCKFTVSLDNLASGSANVCEFEEAVKLQMEQYLTFGLPEDANIFVKALRQHYKT